MAVALEVQNSIHHMFQHPRAGNRSLFRHMSHDKDRNTQSLCKLQEDIGGLSDLRDTARSGRNLFTVHSLYGINDNKLRAFFLDHAADDFKICLTQKIQIRRKISHPVCPEFDLCLRLLSGNIQNFLIFGKHSADLKEQRRFSDPGIASHQHERSGHDPAAQHTVQLVDARFTSCIVVRSHFCQRYDFRVSYRFPDRTGRCGCPLRDPSACRFFYKCIPLPARRTLTEPFRLFVSAVLAEEYRLFPFCHSLLLCRKKGC